MKPILPFSKQDVTDGAAIVPRGFAASSTEPLRAGEPARRNPDFIPAAGLHRRPTASPSLRIRATRANRSLLRWMRAAELAAWQDAGNTSRRGMSLFPR